MDQTEKSRLINIEDRKETRQFLRDKLWTVISAWEVNLKDKREKELRKQDAYTNMTLIENSLKQRIAEEVMTDESGSSKKRFTNQDQRDTALAIRLSGDSEYKKFNSEFIEHTTKIAELVDTLEILKYKFKALLAEVDLERMEI
jgi:hypothetical protein